MTRSNLQQRGGLSATAFRLPFLLGTAGLMFSLVANAESLPSGALPGAISSELLRQPQRALERQDTVPQDNTPALTVPLVGDQKLPENASLNFELVAVVFSETAILDSAQLQALVQPYLGHKVGFSELQQLISAVNRLYDQKGYATARAILPAQRIEGGRVRIQLVEGRVGELVLEGNGYMKQDFIRQRLNIDSGELVDPKRLEAELSRFNRLSSGNLSASLQPGKGYGLTDVYVNVNEPPQNSLELFANNHGYESTGEETGGMMYRHYGALGGDDVFSAFLTGARGSGMGMLSYDAPFNSLGGRIGGRIGKSRAKVIYGPFASLDSQSDSKNGSLFINHPLWSNQSWLLTGQLTYGEQNTRNYISGVFLNENRVKSTQADLTALYLAPGRSLRVSLGYQDARSEVEGTPIHDHFGLWVGYWQLYQALSPDWFLNASGAWQYSKREGVPSSQLFQIGGASTVRGYRQGELAGDGGLYSNLQANYRITQALTGFGFYDYGRIDSSFRQPEKIDSVGTGVNWQATSRLSGELTVGVPLTKVRNDQDSSYINLQLVYKIL
ncbi:ShlB/FhaC/HecB family hemolysin secretion/activation protein [Pseudomonas fluorescens]|uniref:ShlB/FhaC/HecB family hemolysin secretion/activation protein n=1 Tax=Pseudomonas fluorescens TaxID=294 RepID=UPI000641EDFF|nr:ShlB/FhaC/HecB family hemolysin secretion/activation protein [Pseudomonas fluorescens]